MIVIVQVVCSSGLMILALSRRACVADSRINVGASTNQVCALFTKLRCKWILMSIPTFFSVHWPYFFRGELRTVHTTPRMYIPPIFFVPRRMADRAEYVVASS